MALSSAEGGHHKAKDVFIQVFRINMEISRYLGRPDFSVAKNAEHFRK